MQAFEGKCPNATCKNQIYFLSPAPDRVECKECKQVHEESTLLNIKPVSTSIIGFLQNFQKLQAEQIKKKTEALRVKGLSNYGCKLISPLLTKYGLDKSTQEVKLLRTMGQGDAFDCSHLCNRAFMIEPENLHIPEYGRDEAEEYLKDTLKEISYVNGNEERLVPIYADGDGHCLLHAISRALIGRELFWHPLLTNLKEHFMKRQSDYKALLGDFIQDSEWNDIIKEADPNYLPAYGETHGLRNIHVFGLANVLHRPIILIDSLQGMRSKGDYSAVFVPALIEINKCKGADGVLNKPIVIAWSSKGHNHFVPLVGIKGKPIPKYPSSVLPKVWGLNQDLLFNYVEFSNETCIIGGSKTLSEAYLKKLLDAMNNHYQILHGVAPSVVADCYQYIYKPSGVVGMTAQMITEATYALVKEERLYRCLSCSIVTQQELPCPKSWLEPGGKLYDITVKTHGTLKNGQRYNVFPNILCSYDKAKNKLLLVQDVSTLKCKHCGGSIRLVKREGSVVYFNGDQLSTPASSTSLCGCGFKHYWDGKEYDNLPTKIPVTFEWNGVKKEDIIHWFQNESDSSLNSNAFEVAQKVVHKHFPGEFGSERVVQKVVEQIFREALKFRPLEQQTASSSAPPVMPPNLSSSKIILTGAKSKTIHKEELTTSKQEQILRKKIEHGAVLKQKRLSSSPIKQTNIDTSPSKIVNLDKSPNRTADAISASQKEGKKHVEKEHKVRISTSDRGNLMYTLTELTSFDDIQSFIEEKFNINKEVQIIKYGFPLKALEPEGGDKTLPLKLKHGERLMVHVVKPTQTSAPMEVDYVGDNEGDIATANHASNTTTTLRDISNLASGRGPDNLTASSSVSDNNRTGNEYNLLNSLFDLSSNNDAEDSNNLASSLFSLLEKVNLWPLLEKVNLWPWVCTQRAMFQAGGTFHMQATKDLNGMTDAKHVALPYLPNKLFAYNSQTDELYLCLGEEHIPVQPLSQYQEDLAYKATLNKLKTPLPQKIIFPKQSEEMDARADVDNLNNIVRDENFGRNGVDNMMVSNKIDSPNPVGPYSFDDPYISIINDVVRTRDSLSSEKVDIMIDPDEDNKKDTEIEITEKDSVDRRNENLHEEKNMHDFRSNDVEKDDDIAFLSMSSENINTLKNAQYNISVESSESVAKTETIEPDIEET